MHLEIEIVIEIEIDLDGIAMRCRRVENENAPLSMHLQAL